MASTKLLRLLLDSSYPIGVEQEPILLSVFSNLSWVVHFSFTNISIETSVVVECRTNTDLSKIAAMFAELTQALGPYAIGFTLVNSDIFSHEFSCEDVKVPVFGAHFGTVHDNYVTRYHSLDPVPNFACYNVDHMIDPLDSKNVYRLDFFHDQNQLQLWFPIFVHKRNTSNVKFVLIKLNYNNILRFVFDISPNAGCRRSDVKFVIQYLHPPSIFIQPCHNRVPFGVAERVNDRRDIYASLDFAPHLLKSSTLELHVKLSGTEINLLMRQLIECLPCDVNFLRMMDTYPMHHGFRPSLTHWPFEVRYLFEAIRSLGYVGEERADMVFDAINGMVYENRLEELLECMSNYYYRVSTGLQFAKADFITPSKALTFKMDTDYVMIRKAIVTPTRVVLFPPEPIMGCRLVRQYGPERFLRVSFRDDNLDFLRNRVCPRDMLESFVVDKMINGMEIAGSRYFYLGYSNSQLREHGCYFIQTNSIDEVLKIIQGMGKFKEHEGVGKVMARFAQFFTQSKPSPVKLRSDRCKEISDITKKAIVDSTRTKLYNKFTNTTATSADKLTPLAKVNTPTTSTTFSNDVALKDLTAMTSDESISLANVPNSTDIYKQMTTIFDKLIADGDLMRLLNSVTNSSVRETTEVTYCFTDGCGLIRKEFADAMLAQLDMDPASCIQFRYRGYKGVLSVDPTMSSDYDVLFRPSQNKFTAVGNADNFEIVKVSMPVPVRLSRQLINILDQVSLKQACGPRVRKRIMDLFDSHLVEIIHMLTDKDAFLEAFRTLPIFVPIDRLRNCPCLIQEPFFRSVIVAKATWAFKLLKDRKQLLLPAHLGRVMFGIVDTTNSLKFGQVFVRYTENIHAVTGTDPVITLKGRVMVTRNPMSNSGDVRVLEAVEVPALSHLVDVIVFPAEGPRPHPDEMGGGDLDGDEYAVIWDPELMLDKHENAFNYLPPTQVVNSVEMDKLLFASAKFFVDHVCNEAIGHVANAHLGNSDFYGLNSHVCRRLGRKQSCALDFPKTGVPMKKLTIGWYEGTPPERCERYPHFMATPFLPTYGSKRLLGIVHNRVVGYVDEGTAIINRSTKQAIDEQIDCPGWEQFIEDAKRMYKWYAGQLETLMVHYGVVNEGELFSQCFTNLKNRINSKEANNQSQFTTEAIIQSRLLNVFCELRQEFFRRCGVELTATKACTVIQVPVTEVTMKMRQLATAYYKVAYEAGRFLSFPWAAWEVIDAIKPVPSLSSDPVGENVSYEIQHVAHAAGAAAVSGFISSLSMLNSEQSSCKNVRLHRVLFFLSQWKKQHSELDSIPDGLLCSLFIQFGHGRTFSPKGFQPFCFGIGSDISESINTGRAVIWFFAALSSDEFFENISFGTPKQWESLNQVVRCTYFSLAFSVKQKVLREVSLFDDGSSEVPLIKDTPFIVEVPNSYINRFIQNLDSLKHTLGLSHLTHRLRPLRHVFNRHHQSPEKMQEVIIWAKGTVSKIRELRKRLIVEIDASDKLDALETVSVFEKAIIHRYENTLYHI